jgi:60S ribosomal subunit assembly/export protein LOC1
MVVRKGKKVNPQRRVEQEVRSDLKARNLLSITSKNYENAKPNSKTTGKSRPSKKPASSLTKKKKPRVYTDKELGVPKLNKSIDPEGIRRPRGKKGKIFADKDSMLRILHTVNEKVDSQNASKLEKARQLAEIREAKRREMEHKEQEKEEKLNNKKRELKMRRRKDKPSAAEDLEEPSGRRKKVSFA